MGGCVRMATREERANLDLGSGRSCSDGVAKEVSLYHLQELLNPRLEHLF